MTGNLCANGSNYIGVLNDGALLFAFRHRAQPKPRRDMNVVKGVETMLSVSIQVAGQFRREDRPFSDLRPVAKPWVQLGMYILTGMWGWQT